MSRKPNLIIIVGPTASGKSTLAIYLAKKLNGEIISADSQQVYRGLSVGTGRIKGRWIRKDGKNIFSAQGIPHYCIDFISPRKKITVAEYKICADLAIRDITRRGKLPILTGGTGFWIDTVVLGTELPHVPPDQKLRVALNKKATKELLNMLKKLDKTRAQRVDQKNPRRIIRAIEIAKKLGNVPPLKKTYPYHALWLGISIPELRWIKIMQKRARRMVATGIVEETKKLIARKISLSRIREFGFEYADVLYHLKEKITRAELAENIIKDTQKYKHRQMTWFHKNPSIQWVQNKKKAERIIRNFLSATKKRNCESKVKKFNLRNNRSPRALALGASQENLGMSP